MNSIRMNLVRKMLGGLIALALTACVGQAKANITYNLVSYPDDQNGAALSGFITTDGTLGNLGTSDILSWSWTITPVGGSPVTVSSSDPESSAIVDGMIIASLVSITIGAATGPIDFNGFVLQGDTSNHTILEYYRSGNEDLYLGSTASGPNTWANFQPVMGNTDPWVIATAAAVPEPSSLALLATAFIGLGAGYRRYV